MSIIILNGQVTLALNSTAAGVFLSGGNDDPEGVFIVVTEEEAIPPEGATGEFNPLQFSNAYKISA